MKNYIVKHIIILLLHIIFLLDYLGVIDVIIHYVGNAGEIFVYVFYVSPLVILRVFSNQCSSSGEVESQTARFISSINTFILCPGDG